MTKFFSRTSGIAWTLGRIVLLRLIIYLIIMGFFLHYLFFGEWVGFGSAYGIAGTLSVFFLINLLVLAVGSRYNRLNPAIALAFALDTVVLTHIILITGGFHSLFIPFYIPILIMGPATLPGNFAALFPSLATLGVAYIGLGHLIHGYAMHSQFYGPAILASLRIMSANTAIASMLALSALFFVISYISSVISVRFQALSLRIADVERDAARFSAISALAAGLAHEVRNPLASLRSAIQEIGESFADGSQNLTLMRIVISESDRLDRIVSRFLDFSRDEMLQFLPCRLGEILEEVRIMILKRDDIGELGIKLVVRDDPVVECDSDRLHEVFFNLTLNAAQAADMQGGHLEISLASSWNSLVPGVEIVFSDNGPGLPKDAMRRIFDPFYSSKPNGGGMGLALCRKHISLHGGHIEAGGNPGGGARFSVWLPLAHMKPGFPGERSIGGNTVRLIKPKSCRVKQ
ncbi:MAG: hypothetical protein LBE84_09825 [Planctomycetota bacterium]|jgi:signal transduction histidine kinase|nr:hypothetical protein [Planctomycetota bacterium]